MADVCWINDTELQSFGLQIMSVTGLWDGLTYRRGAVDMPGMAGAMPFALASVDPRDITIVVQLEVATITAREAALNALDAHLNGLLEVRFADQPDKVIECVQVAQPTLPETGQSFLDKNADLFRTITLRAHKPVKLARFGSAVSFGSTRQQVALGTLPSSGTVFLMGSATDPVLRYRTANGALVGQMGFTVTLASTDYLAIDLRRWNITKFVSGTSSSGASLLNTADRFFRLDPSDGDFANTSWPTLEVSAGSGLILYRKEYES